jgi:hypothetical protein
MMRRDHGRSRQPSDNDRRRGVRPRPRAVSGRSGIRRLGFLRVIVVDGMLMTVKASGSWSFGTRFEDGKNRRRAKLSTATMEP